jgi:hypothetical protein
MNPIKEKLTALRLELIVAQRADDIDRCLANFTELLAMVTKIKARDLSLTLTQRIIFVILRRRLIASIHETCTALRLRLAKELELTNLQLQIVESKQKGMNEGNNTLLN